MSYTSPDQGPGPHQQGVYQPGPQPQLPPQSSPQLQAAWRFSARRKNDTTAWLLWICGPFIAGLPVHDFYFGDIARGLAKIGLLVMVWVFLFGGIIVSAIRMEVDSSAFPAEMMVGFILAGLSVLAVFVWWVYDGVNMSRRLESTNNQIRQEIAADSGIDPWSF